MAKLEKIVVLESEVQAQLLGVALREQNIPHLLRSYHDSAYDGLFQNLKGWGHVEAPAEYRQQILRTLAELARHQVPGAGPDSDGPPPRPSSDAS